MIDTGDTQSRSTGSALRSIMHSQGARQLVIALIAAALASAGTYGVALRQADVELVRIGIEARRTEVDIWRGLIDPLYLELERANAKIEALRDEKHQLLATVRELEREVRQLRLDCMAGSL